MNTQELLRSIQVGEEKDWEFKSARGGVPNSLWETYSAMANTDGGFIVLGVEQRGNELIVRGLEDPNRIRKSFWDTIHNPTKISVNLLSDDDVVVEKFTEASLLVVRVPRATRHQRPVYIGQNPLTGTYRRDYDGDYHCSQDEVGRMLADRAEEPADSRILENFGLDDLDESSIQQYRQRLSALRPTHPWLSEDVIGLLRKLGGWRRDRKSGQDGPTAAGLLMFGKAQAIGGPDAVPQYHLDYRERYSQDPEVRWTDRLTIDGTWEANLFQFYQRVIRRLVSDLKTPFQLDTSSLFRRDDTLVHEAIREAMVNALIHADYRGQGGIVVDKYPTRFEISNPGSLLVSMAQLLQGGVSECRNKALQTMFLMIGGGEKAGSGIDKIRRGWQSQHWRQPSIQESLRPDRVRIVLPMVSLLPDESVRRLRKLFGARFAKLDQLQVQALVTADVEGSVSNPRMQEMSAAHPADLTRMLQDLARRSFLRQEGQRRWTSYRLADGPVREMIGLPHSLPGFPHKPDFPHKEARRLSRSLQGFSEKELEVLKTIAAPAFSGCRLRADKTRSIILELCKGRFLSAAHLGALMGRSSKGLSYRFLTPMVQEGLLRLKFPDKPNRPDQAYTARTRE